MERDKLLEALNSKIDATFKFEEIRDVNHRPHPYCISKKHLKYSNSMFLGEEQIKQMEKQHGSMCGMYVQDDKWRDSYKKGYTKCQLTYEQHKSDTVIFVLCYKEGWNQELFKQIVKENEDAIDKIAKGFTFIRSWND